MDKKSQLHALYAELHADYLFAPLREAAALVPGDGPATARVMLIGEAPGRQEDRAGKPFVGASGRLLDDLLQIASLERKEVFITNVVKYRPPGNRDPEPEEVDYSRYYLRKEIDIIAPSVIVLLGRFAFNVFFPGESISHCHGQARHHKGKAYLPLYHPAVALYNGRMRPTLEEDMLRLKDLI